MRWKIECFNTGRDGGCAAASGACALWYLLLALAGLFVFREMLPNVPVVLHDPWKGLAADLPGQIPFGLRFRNWALLCILLEVSISDIKTRIISNRSIIAGVILWGIGIVRTGSMRTVFLAGTEALTDIAAASAIGLLCFILAVLFKRVRKRTALGGGDIKLFFLGGLLLGPVRSLYMILIAGILGLLTAALMHAASDRKPIPFGPAIASAIAVLLFCS